MAGEYAELIKGLGLELETMAKAIKDEPKDEADKKLAAKDAKEGEAVADDDAKDEDKDKESTLGKSFSMKLEDGSTVEAYDGTQAIAELVAQNAELRGAVDDLQKAFGAAVEVLKQMRQDQTEQGTLIKSYGTKLSTAVSSPAGRRSMVSIMEKLSPAEGKAKADEPNPQRVMAKARDLCQTGKMTWDQISRIEAFQNRGIIAPPDLLAHFPDLAS